LFWFVLPSVAAFKIGISRKRNILFTRKRKALRKMRGFHEHMLNLWMQTSVVDIPFPVGYWDY